MQEWTNEIDVSADTRCGVIEDSVIGTVCETRYNSQEACNIITQSESARSYQRVCQNVRSIIDDPVALGVKRYRRFQSSYGLPVIWCAMGCLFGLGYTVEIGRAHV